MVDIREGKHGMADLGRYFHPLSDHKNKVVTFH